MVPIITTPELLRRFAASLSAGLVLLLTLAAASPKLHEELHADHAVPHADACAVVLFAAGVTAALATALVSAPRLCARELVGGEAPEIFLVAPRYLWQPERGPPSNQE